MNANEIRTIAEQHPESVALVFEAYGIRAESTPRNLSNAVKIFKQPFVQSLQHAISEESNFLGLFKSKEERQMKKEQRLARKNPVSKLGMVGLDGEQNSLTAESDVELPTERGQKSGMLFDGAVKVLNAIRALKYGTRENEDDNRRYQGDDRILGIHKPLFLALLAISALVVILIIRKQK